MHRITLRQVAALAGVHPSSVSLALADSPRLPTATKERILQAVQRLGYVRSPDAVRPEVLISTSGVLLDPLRRHGWEIPEQLGFVALIADEESPEVSGMEIQHRAIAAAAVDLLDAKLRRHEHGVPRTRQTLLISPVWRPGQTLRARV